MCIYIYIYIYIYVYTHIMIYICICTANFVITMRGLRIPESRFALICTKKARIRG